MIRGMGLNEQRINQKRHRFFGEWQVGEVIITRKVGIKLGKTLGMKLSGKAEILGGVILIGIGLEIFITGVFI